MTLPGQWGKVLVLAQCHPPAFQEALLIGGRETLQLGRRDPMRSDEESKQGLPDALEEISLHRRIEPRQERLHAAVEKAQGSISVVPIPAPQMADGPPVMREQLWSHEIGRAHV